MPAKRQSPEHRNLQIVKHVADVASFPIGSWVWRSDNASGAKELAKMEYQEKSKRNTSETRIKRYITVATPTEAGSVREQFVSDGYTAKYQPNIAGDFGGWVVRMDEENPFEPICIVSAEDHGRNFHDKLLQRISRHTYAETVVCVGCMGGRKDKVRLFDVVIPRQVYDGAAIGAVKGELTLEDFSARFTPRFTSTVASIASKISSDTGIKLITTKRTVASGNVIDDMDSELMRLLIARNPEEIVGIEMEGFAIASANQDNMSNKEGRSITFGMIKGVSDFGRQLVDGKKEIENLDENLRIYVKNNAFDPRENKEVKEAVQDIAIRRAAAVAMMTINLL